MRAKILFLMAALAGGGALAGEVDFATKPQARKAGGKTVITFALKQATDVEVAVLDAGGKVIRHLAAGALGAKQAPPAPLKPGLSQTIEWDGRDDAGKPARGAARVRVRLGLKPVFDRTIGGDPARHGGPLGLGCGPEGTLYVLYRCGGPGHHYASMGIKAYDREGKYLRQVMPYPANLKPEQRTAVKWMELDDGSSVPLVYYAHSRVMYPGTGSGGRHNLMVRPDGKLAFSNHPFDRPSITTRRMLVFGADGSCGKDLLGPRTTRGKVGGWLLTALSPDGKTIYISGGRNRKGAVPAVFKTTWESTAEPTVFVGSETAPGSDAKSLAAPRGVAVDGQGNVYVCDHLNNRVSVFSPEGKPLAQMPAEYADLVAVHPETGAVYVLTTRHNPKMIRSRNWGSGANFLDKKLLKFKDYKAKVPMASIQVSKSSPARPSMALDSSANPPVLWLSGLVWGSGSIKKIVDRGAKFEDAGTPISARVAKGTLGTGWLDMAVDRHTDGIIVSQQSRQFVSWKYDGRSGKFLGTVKFKSRMGRGQWGEVAFSWDGRRILHTTSLEKLYLFNLDGSQLPWPELGKNEMGDIPQGFTHARARAGAGRQLLRRAPPQAPRLQDRRSQPGLRGRQGAPQGVHQAGLPGRRREGGARRERVRGRAP